MLTQIYVALWRELSSWNLLLWRVSCCITDAYLYVFPAKVSNRTATSLRQERSPSTGSDSQVSEEVPGRGVEQPAIIAQPCTSSSLGSVGLGSMRVICDLAALWGCDPAFQWILLHISLDWFCKIWLFQVAFLIFCATLLFLLTFFWVGCCCGMWLCFSPGTTSWVLESL